MIITIDGPVGTGKSTVAKRLAESLGFLYVDTGAMYRCVTYGIIKHRIDVEDLGQLNKFLNAFHVAIEEVQGTLHYFFEGEEVTEKIRLVEVASLVSRVSAVAAVRKKLVDLQKQLGSGADAVFEGRDMGTVVFPNAELKFFLTARPEVRAQRRYEELRQKFPGRNPTFEEVLKNLHQRDLQDSTRAISPLQQAADAHLIDCSDLSIEEVLHLILEIKQRYCTNPLE